MYLCLIWLFKFKITLPSTLFKFLLMCFAKLFFGYSLSIWYPNFTSFVSFQYFRTTILFSCIKSFHSLNRLIPLSILKCKIFWFNRSILHDIEIALVQRVLLPELLCEKDQISHNHHHYYYYHDFLLKWSLFFANLKKNPKAQDFTWSRSKFTYFLGY